MDWNGHGIEGSVEPSPGQIRELVLGLFLHVPGSLDTGPGNLGSNDSRWLCQLSESFDNPDEMYSQKTFAWSSNHLFQIFGALTLTVGAFVFATLDDVLWWYPTNETKTLTTQSSDEDIENK